MKKEQYTARVFEEAIVIAILVFIIFSVGSYAMDFNTHYTFSAISAIILGAIYFFLQVHFSTK